MKERNFSNYNIRINVEDFFGTNIYKFLKKKRRFNKAPFLYPGRDLNPHGRNAHWILSPTCLPIPPPGQLFKKMSLAIERLYS